MLKIYKIAFVLLICFFTNVSYGEPLGEVPFGLIGPNGETVLELTVEIEGDYAVQLNYHFDKNNPSDRKKMWNAAGGDSRIKPGQWKRLGAPFDVETVIIDSLSNKEIYKSSISHPKLTSIESDKLNAELCRAVLKEGKYKIIVRRIGSANGLENTTVSISIAEAYHGK